MTSDPPWPPAIGGLLPRADDAYAAPEKLDWILAEDGHGPEWKRVFRIGEDDAPRLWAAVARTLPDAPIVRVADREPHGVVCGVEIELVIGLRIARARTAWHYERVGDAPRLVTAYPRL